MEKNAVEWLVDQLPIRILNMYRDEIAEAKLICEEQIEGAWDDGYDKGRLTRLEKVSKPVGDAKTYYNNKFKP